MGKKYYKAFNRDMTCRDQRYEEGGIYELPEGAKPELCSLGFHFMVDLVLTLGYYPVNNDITENIYAEVEPLGEVVWEEPTKHKGCTNKLRIIRVIPDDEVKAMIDAKNNSGDWNSGDWNSGHRNSGDWNSGDWNSGDWNSGHRNSGDWNSGDWNSGDWNSGHRNSGHRNSGDWNSGDWNSGDWNSGHRNSGHRNSGHRNSGHRNSGHRNSGHRNSGHRNSGHRNSGDWNSGDWNSCNKETGFLNTEDPKTVRIFNKPCDVKDWEAAYKPRFLFFDIDESLGYKGSFKKSWEAADKKDRMRIKELPNFDEEIFFELSGIRVSDYKNASTRTTKRGYCGEQNHRTQPIKRQ